LAVPVTLVVILPTNKRLLSQRALGDRDASLLLRRWGRLHLIRTTVGVAGFAILVCEAVF
jgi:hypothetical protein